MKIEIEKLEEMRKNALDQSELAAKKERFGLFSQPPPLSIGDNDYKTTHPPRGDEGKGEPITKPRQIQTQPLKTGKSTRVYFDAKVYHEGEKYPDPYLDPDKIYKQGRDAKGTKKKGKKGEGEETAAKAPFLPAVAKWAVYSGKNNAKRFGAPYEHVDGPNRVQKRKIKDAEGRVIIKPRNIQSHPVRHGKYNSTYGHTINKYPEYMPDVKPSTKKQAKSHRDKWNHHYVNVRGGHFRSTCFPKRVLNVDKQIYGYKRPEQVEEVKRRVRNKDAPMKEPFKPSHPGKKGRLGTLGKFQRLIPKPRPRKVRVKGEEGPKKDAFKPSRGYLSRPTPSITLNKTNIGRYMR